MRIRSREKLNKKNEAIVFLFLLPILGFATYAIGLVVIMNDMAAYTFEIDPPDTDYFYTMDEIDPNIMAEVADAISYRLNKSHLNMLV